MTSFILRIDTYFNDHIKIAFYENLRASKISRILEMNPICIFYCIELIEIELKYRFS